MSNEPVAWVELEAWESGKYPPDDCFAEHPFENAIPLYTHPVKKLSGVEIIGMSGKYDFNYEVDIIDFARAIVRKASEK